MTAVPRWRGRSDSPTAMCLSDTVEVSRLAHALNHDLMAIHVAGTFAYVFDVTEPLERARRLTGRLRESLRAGERRLVGHAPVLEATEYQREPWQLYARITLGASDEQATVRQVSFSVERGVVRVLQRGDVLHLGRTHSGGVGLSIIRDDYLVAAAGAITSVPLGSDIVARCPGDLAKQAEAIFRTRDPQYNLRDCPLELSIAGQTRILHAGRGVIGSYDVLVRHGFLWGLPGSDVCASIERRGVCPDTAAHTSAQLLDEEGLQTPPKR